MKRGQVLPLVFGLLFAVTGNVVNAQTTGDSASAPPSRKQVKKECDAFFKIHQYDAVKGIWVPAKGAPRDLSKLTRAQVRTETMQFYRAHEWNDVTSTWVAKKPRPTKPMKK